MDRDVVIESASGQRIMVRLGDQIGRTGAQGEVHEVADYPEAAAKIIHDPRRQRVAQRLDAMLVGPLAWTTRQGLLRVAWPVGRVRRRSDDQVIGYLLPRLRGPEHVELPRILDNRYRSRLLPGSSWLWYLQLGADLALTVADVGRQGHVIGDLAPPNVFVTRAAVATIVDVDGWQIRDPRGVTALPCAFSRDEYTAPEHLDDPSSGELRRPQSDWWALAVILGQLLFLGVHPFGGVLLNADAPREESDNVRERRCWLLGDREVELPTWSPPRDLLPATLLRLFEACFDSGYAQPDRRPSPGEWAKAFEDTQSDLTTCARRPLHVYARSSPSCPWCLLVANGHPDRFPLPGQAAQAPAQPPRPPARAASVVGASPSPASSAVPPAPRVAAPPTRRAPHAAPTLRANSTVQARTVGVAVVIAIIIIVAIIALVAL